MKQVPCEVYSRVVGYYRPVQNWNEGKQQEFREREEFCEKTSLENPKATANVGTSPELEVTKSETPIAGNDMGIESYKIFTFPNCEKCEEVKTFLNTKPFSGDIVDLKTPEGNREFRTYYADKSIKSKIRREENGTLELPIVLFMNKGNVVSTSQGVIQTKTLLI